jgi:hypothetical protein
MLVIVGIATDPVVVVARAKNAALVANSQPLGGWRWNHPR